MAAVCVIPDGIQITVLDSSTNMLSLRDGNAISTTEIFSVHQHVSHQENSQEKISGEDNQITQRAIN